MKWLFALLLALAIFGGAAYFAYNVLFKQEIAVQKEQRGEIPATPLPDLSMPEFQEAAKLRQEGNLVEARNALFAFIQKYPNGQHFEEAKDLLGAVNIDILFSPLPSPEKKEYIVKKGDVIARVAQKMKQPPRINTKVAEILAWKNGKRVGFGTREYQTSMRWIRLANAGYTIYAIPDASHPSSDQPPPPLGLGISASEAEELSSLVNGKTPVTITE